MNLLPVSLSLKNRKCLIVGSHQTALELAHELSVRQAKVMIITSQTVSLPAAAEVLQREFHETDLDDCWLVIAASHSPQQNNLIRQLCDSRCVFCNVVAEDHTVSDDARSSWFFCSGNSNAAASATASPAEVPNAVATPAARAARQPAAGLPPSTAQTASDSTASRVATSSALVSLVGAGPGDPELLTVRAVERIQHADAIVYDRLVSQPILDLCNPDAEFVYAGKAKANHALPQKSINERLVALAQQHQRVVRLKGGDPFIFGRGGEEIETLADQHVAFEVVPGITAASGCSAFSGIPLTHRDHAQSVIFVTGHLRNGNINLNWQELADPQLTIVVYMGLTGLDAICESLIQHGRLKDTPAALIEQGTKPQQRVLVSTLSDLPGLVTASDVSAPTLLIIGSVVSLRDKLKWFGSHAGQPY